MHREWLYFLLLFLVFFLTLLYCLLAILVTPKLFYVIKKLHARIHTHTRAHAQKHTRVGPFLMLFAFVLLNTYMEITCLYVWCQEISVSLVSITANRSPPLMYDLHQQFQLMSSIQPQVHLGIIISPASFPYSFFSHVQRQTRSVSYPKSFQGSVCLPMFKYHLIIASVSVLLQWESYQEK